MGEDYSPESLQVPSHWINGVFVGNACDISSQLCWELLLEEGVPSRGSSIPRRIYQLCGLYRCCKVKCCSGDELFLPCQPDWWRQSCASSAVWFATGRDSGERVAERQRGGGLSGWIMQEQRQLERSSTGSRHDVSNVLTFCSLAAGFRTRRYHFKTNIVKFDVRYFFIMFLGIFRNLLQVFELTAHVFRGLMTSGEKVFFSLGSGGNTWEIGAWCPALHTWLCQKPALYATQLFLWFRCCDANKMHLTTTSAVFSHWSHVGSTSSGRVVTDLCACMWRVVHRRRARKDTKEQWYAAGGVKPSSEDSVSGSGVPIPTVVKEPQVAYVPVNGPPVSVPGPAPCVPLQGR